MKVKLVCQVGVAVVAAGVAKCNAEQDLGLHCTVEPIVDVTAQRLRKFCGGCADYFLEARIGEYHQGLSKCQILRLRYCADSARTALPLSVVMVDFDNPFPEYVCFDCGVPGSLRKKSELSSH